GGIRDFHVTGVQTCALPIWNSSPSSAPWIASATIRLMRSSEMSNCSVSGERTAGSVFDASAGYIERHDAVCTAPSRRKTRIGINVSEHRGLETAGKPGSPFQPAPEGIALSGQGREAVGKALQIDRDADAFLGRLKHYEGRRGSVPERIEEGLFQNDLGIAAVLEAADEIGATYVLAVNIEAESVRQKHAKRREHAQDFGLVVGRAQHDDRQAHFRTVLGNDVLHHDALFGGRTRGRIAYDRPCAVGGLDGAVRLGRLSRSRKRERRQAGDLRKGSRKPVNHEGSIQNQGTLSRVKPKEKRMSGSIAPE